MANIQEILSNLLNSQAQLPQPSNGFGSALSQAGLGILLADEKGYSPLTSIASGISSYNTERDAAQKRQQDYQTQALNNLLVTQKALDILTTTKPAFEGTSFDIQSANEQYNQYRNAGYSESDARIRAINDVRESQVSIDTNTGYIMQGRGLPQVGSPMRVPSNAPLNPLMQGQDMPSSLPDAGEGQQLSPLMQGGGVGVNPSIQNSPVVQTDFAKERNKLQAQKEFDLPKLQKAFQESRDQKRIIIENIDLLLNTPNLLDSFSAGAGSTLKYLPLGSDANTVDATIETIKSNIATDKLQKLRELSPTGGALGNASDKDIELLANSKGMIRQDLKPEVLKSSLSKIRADLVNSDTRALSAFEQDTGTPISGTLSPLPEVKAKKVDTSGFKFLGIE